MGLVYEHWRPDTNECFYVGASRDAEDTRPYDYGSHNDNYDIVTEYLSEKNLTPFTKIIWENLPRESTGVYEKMRISYQRSLLGKKLTNIANGGDGFNFDWDDELRARQSQIMIDFYKTPEGQEALKKSKENLPRGENHPSKRPERKSHQSSLMFSLWEDEDFRNKVLEKKPESNAKNSATHKALWQDPEHRAKYPLGENHSSKRPEVRKKFSDKRNALIQDVEHVKRHRESCTPINRDIGNRPEVRSKRKSNALELWESVEFRMKMLPRDWHRSNVRPYPYWGA
jgi:hypothetical protein